MRGDAYGIHDKRVIPNSSNMGGDAVIDFWDIASVVPFVLLIVWNIAMWKDGD